MRKSFLILLFSTSIFADWETKVDGVVNLVFGSKVNVVFGQVWPGARIQVSHPLKWGVHYWAGADFFHVKGSILGLEKDTALTYLPLGTGLRYQAAILPGVDIYLGGGPRLGALSIQNDILKTRRMHRSFGWGMVGFTGLNLSFTENMNIDLMSNVGSTTFQNTGLSGHIPYLDLKLGGYDFAVGLKLKF